MPQGMYYRRGHWVKTGRRRNKTSGWLIAAFVVVVAYVAFHAATDSSAAPAAHVGGTATPTPTASASR